MSHLAETLDLSDDPRAAQARTLNDLAMALAGEGATDAAIVMLRRAATLDPSIAHPLANLGLLSYRMNDHATAWNALSQAVTMDPDNASYHGNLGVFASAMNEPEIAEKHLTEAIRLAPDNLAPRWDRALLWLRQGDWARGLAEYETRIAHRGPTLYPGMPVPLWHGEELSGKTLYVQGEQGVGDRILLSRYLAWIKQRWPDCRLLTCLNDELTNLFWEFNSQGISLMPSGIPWPKAIDYAAWLGSLPGIHGSLPDHVPADPGLLRLRARREATRCVLPPPALRSLRVGICWTGSPTMLRNAERSVPLSLLMPLAEDPRIQLYSLQVGPGRDELIRSRATAFIVDVGAELEREGWIGTALALCELDLVITVCTSVAHLAGALGVSCWTLLCADPYWIWGRSGETTAWYPGMKLFRQECLGDWAPVLAAVRSELSMLAKDI